jgi:hypothetical protein
MHNHRNISIDEIDNQDYEFTCNTAAITEHNNKHPETNTLFESNSISLMKRLMTQPLIYRIYPRTDGKLNISVESKHFREEANWIDHVLDAFTDYCPLRILPTNSGLRRFSLPTNRKQ